jgi:hypothetical protein
MAKSEPKIQQISDELNEHIIAVKGTLELLETSVSDNELHNLLLKAIERMDTIQRLSNEMIAFLKQILDKMKEIKSGQPETENP